jgi:hypothetical protein
MASVREQQVGDSREQFEQEAITRTAPEFRHAAPDAARAHLAANPKQTDFSNDDYAAVGRIAAEYHQRPPMMQPAESAAWLKGQPLEVVTSTETATWAQPWAEAIRRDLFGSDAPPFATLEAASGWILEEGDSASPDAALVAKVGAWARDTQRGIDELMEQGCPFDLSHRQDAPVLTLPVAVKDANDNEHTIVSALWSARLNRLAHEADAMAGATGWDQGQAVAFVLVEGILPSVPRLRAKVSLHPAPANHGQAGPLVRHWWDVRAQGADITRDDLNQFFTQMRRCGFTQKKPVRPHEVHAYLIDQEFPKGSFTDQQRLDKYHERYPEHRERITRIQGFRKAVKKARKHAQSTVGGE